MENEGRINELIDLNSQAITQLSQNMGMMFNTQNDTNEIIIRMNEIVASVTETAIKSAVDKATGMVDGFNQTLKATDIRVDEVNNKFEDYKVQIEIDKNVIVNGMRVDKNKFVYGSQADFGLRFKVSIGSITVGKLFKVIGIAKSSKGRTEPKRESILNGRATTDSINGYEVFRWNHEKCLKALEKWLRENDLFEEFYSIETEKDLKIYINEMFNEFVI